VKKPLLIEIGVEELPAVPLLKELKNIEKKWKDILDEYNFLTDFQFFFTPRRFVFWHREFLPQQPNQIKEQFGAPVQIAYKDGIPTKACEGFARKCGVSVEKLKTAQKNGKDVLYYKSEEVGKTLDSILEEIILKFLTSLNFGKSMRWGDGKYNFIRPIHSVISMFGDKNIPVTIFGIKSKNETFGHRTAKNQKIHLNHTGDYFCNLPKNGVMLKQKERELTILNQFEKLEQENNIKIEVNSDLLNEIVAITEEPTSLIGNFETQFLELPDEVVITSMREHQRYFPVYKNSKLTNQFIVVSNAYTKDFSKIVSGNERVLRARLSDALFFYKNDLKKGLIQDGLEKLIFVKGLGTMSNKIEREQKIALVLAKNYNFQNLDILERTINLAKTDLMSEMVYEFTELQGLMGSYYAEKLGEDPQIVTAIREQYFPNGESKDMPTTELSSIVAMSYKLDLLFGLFSIGHIPTGSRDPFGLRRAVNGILKISLDGNMRFNLDEVFEQVSKNYQDFDFKKLKDFFFERVLNFYTEINASIVKSVISVEKEILNIDKKIYAVNQITQNADFEKNLSTFKRVANILKDSNIQNMGEVKIELLTESAEITLFKEFEKIVQNQFTDYLSKLQTLFSLKPHLDNFFENVMVNTKEADIRENRKNLMAKMYLEFLEISDIKDISVGI